MTIRILAEKIFGDAIPPRFPEPKIIEPATAERNATRPQQPAAVVKRAVDEDADRPRAPRIHTISAYQNDDVPIRMTTVTSESPVSEK